MAPVKTRPKTTKYTEEAVQAACQAVLVSKKGLREAARDHGVPPSTLRDRLKGRKPFHEIERTVITTYEEERLVIWMKECARRGFGRTMNQVQRAVQSILNQRKAVTVSKDNLPGKKWVSLFLKRHKDVTLSTPQALGAQRAAATEAKHPMDPPSPTTYPSALPPLAASPLPSCSTIASSSSSSSSHVITPLPAISASSSSQSSSITTIPAALCSSSAEVGPSTKELLDRLLDLAAEQGLHRLIHFRTLHSLGNETDDPAERLFSSFYSRLITFVPPKTNTQTDSDRDNSREQTFDNLPLPL
ncbi:tigger transposable element-derived protein 6-like protein [Elysia marginata]|uniref:Tigger transposable element-derived protein 6-like protein n=1 Tax=Elysia marginata TaxID=1093978 RepID=A0AAV4FQ57_9GAST|nr:tigger transposable element-derived protein 6-like protein [Elysia marginata]